MANFLIYKSSAGSGKTYTLVKEYLKLVLLHPAEFRNTLAVTFTNKAAAEMKTRIIESLKKLAEGKDPWLLKTLIDEGVNDDISQKAKLVLSNILHNYSYFSVSTIDSFFHKVIRSFAKELKLSLGYDVEMDTDSVLAKITDDMFDKIGEDEDLREYLENFIYYNIDDKGDWRIEHKIKDLAKEIFKERYWEKTEGSRGLEKFDRPQMSSFISEMFKVINIFENKMNEFSMEAKAHLAKHKKAVADFPYGSSGYLGYLINNIPNKKYEPGKRALSAAEDINNCLAKNSLPIIRKVLEDGLWKTLSKAVNYYNKNHKAYFTATELTKTIYILGIFNDLLLALKDYRDENKVLLISDTNNILRKIIANEPSPFIYEKIGNTYKNYLIDEFQDTSNFQWSNMLPLVENSLSEGNFSMVAGDVKQSIYRWRGGNMMLLLEKIELDLQSFKDSIEETNLLDNRRSLKDIIAFNNMFFEEAALKIAEKNPEYESLIKRAYSEVSQNDAHSKNGGYVRVNFIPYNKEEELSPADISDIKTLEIIKELLGEGFEPRDILVLSRKKSEGTRIAGLLLSSGYKVISSESLLIKNSPKIKLLVNLLKYSVDKNNVLAKTEILFDYLVYIKQGEENFKSIFEDFKNASSPIFSSKLPAEYIELESGKSGTNNDTLYELVENLIRIFELNRGPDTYVMRFLDTVLDYINKYDTDINSFLLWWEENKDDISIVIPAAENAIQVMTIHKAKGLESPAVIIPYTNWELDVKSGSFMWVNSDIKPFEKSPTYIVKAAGGLRNTYFEKDYEEESVMSQIDNLNLLYVAFTRAVERLYISCPEKGIKSSNAGSLIESVLLPGKSEMPEGGVLEFGKKENKKTAQKPRAEKSFNISSVANCGAYQKPIIRIHNALSDKGRLIHEALSYIETSGDIKRAIDKLILKGLIPESKKDEYIKELEEIINFEDVKSWFSGKWKVLTESEILIPKGDTLRPDRIMTSAGKTVIIDYKTGSESQSKSHEVQINKYADALTLAGHNSIEKYIYYTTLKTLKKL